VYIPPVIDFLTGSGVALVAALVPSEWTLARVASGHSPLTALTWIAALVLMIRAVPGAVRPQRPAARSARAWWRLSVVLLPCLVRLATLRSDRIHGDDLITAYFSTRYDLARTDFFAPVPPNLDDWVCQFPAPFFALQKLFFVLFGENLLTVKLSILPYVIATSGFLYAIARDLVGERAAVLCMILYAFFGPSVYLETLGLHFVSSTAVFLAFFYFSLRELRQGAPRHALLAGMTAGASYLFYLSSFLALPIAALFFLARGSPQRERHVGRNLALFTLGVMMVLSPFVLRTLQTPNALFRRFEQVSLIGGEWSAYPRQIANGETLVRIVRDNVRLSLQSIARPGIGGSGGYDFGKQPLLETLSLVLFALGTLRAIALAWTSIEWSLVLVTTALFFVVNVGLSIPPPAFHRFSIGFPFLCLLLALPLDALLEIRWGGAAWRRTVVASTLAAFACTQTWYARRAMIPESDFDELRLARFVDEQYPGRPLYVAAFPTYAFERFYHFARTRRDRRVTSDYHATLLESFDPHRKYVYVITLPAAFDAQFARRDPRGRIIHFSPQLSLFVN
jgi:Dolichyl-phosphate-mannose-protein mannosyltransferase